MTTPAEARTAALGALGLAAGVGIVASLVKGQWPSVRVAFGGLGAAVMLTGAAGAVPELVHRFAALIAIGALLYGIPAITPVLARLFGSSSSSAPAPAVGD